MTHLPISDSDILSAIPGIQELQPRLPESGQGAVFPCKIAGTKYALKVMPVPDPGPDEDPEELDEVSARAAREVAILEACDSRHIVKLGPLPMSSIGSLGKTYIYFTEEWIDGPSVASLIRNSSPLSTPMILALATQIISAIDVLWSFGKIHRDIKPANIMWREASREFVLLDMGVAFDLYADSLTSGGPVGTKRYFSPEQHNPAKKRDLDFRSDLFSLGIVLYEAATGQHPFWTPSIGPTELARRIQMERPIRPTRINAQVSQSLESAILKLLQKQAHMRFRRCPDAASAFDVIVTESES